MQPSRLVAHMRSYSTCQEKIVSCHAVGVAIYVKTSMSVWVSTVVELLEMVLTVA